MFFYINMMSGWMAIFKLIRDAIGNQCVCIDRPENRDALSCMWSRFLVPRTTRVCGLLISACSLLLETSGWCVRRIQAISSCSSRAERQPGWEGSIIKPVWGRQPLTNRPSHFSCQWRLLEPGWKGSRGAKIKKKHYIITGFNLYELSSW